MPVKWMNGQGTVLFFGSFCFLNYICLWVYEYVYEYMQVLKEASRERWFPPPSCSYCELCADVDVGHQTQVFPKSSTYL